MNQGLPVSQVSLELQDRLDKRYDYTSFQADKFDNSKKSLIERLEFSYLQFDFDREIVVLRYQQLQWVWVWEEWAEEIFQQQLLKDLQDHQVQKVILQII